MQSLPGGGLSLLCSYNRGRDFENAPRTNHPISLLPGVKWESSHLQPEPEEGGGDGGAVDGPVAPGGAQAHRVVAVHVGEKKQPRSGTLADLPEVHGQRGPGDDLSVG